MRPAIQYVNARDGVRIAYATFGSGEATPLLVLRPPQFSHLEREWELGPSHHEFERFMDQRRVIRFDPRGTGLSERGAADQSLDARLLDLDAVVGAIEIDRFVLDSISSASLVAMAYAARRPERVERLIVQNAFASGAEWWGIPQRRALLALSETDWSVCAETWAWLTFGSTDNEQVRALGQHIRECITPADFVRMVRAEERVDLTPELPSIVAPAVVLVHPVFERLAPAQPGRELAAAIPRARAQTVRSTEERVRTIAAFLAEPLPASVAAPPHASRAIGGAQPAPQALSRREREVLALLATGMTNRAIADRIRDPPRHRRRRDVVPCKSRRT